MERSIRHHQSGTPSPKSGRSRLVVVVPAGIADSSTLLRVLAERLRCPDWFGGNWNALSDCLRDLSWLPQRTVVLWHEDLPPLPLADLELYQELLADSAVSWTPGDAHRLEISFPAV